MNGKTLQDGLDNITKALNEMGWGKIIGERDIPGPIEKTAMELEDIGDSLESISNSLLLLVEHFTNN